jgi:hypothetical protein
MKTMMIRYKVKAERAEENIELIKAVFAELKAAAPTELRYATFTEADGLSFVHIVSSTDESNEQLTSLLAFKNFASNIQERCQEPPATAILEEVASYKSFGALDN